MSSAKRWSRPRAIWAGVKTRIRAAANSMARGMPSKRRQMSATADDVGIGEGKTRSGPAGPVDEQLHRLAGDQTDDPCRTVIAPVTVFGHGQRGDSPGDLAGQVEGLAAGGEDVEGRTRRHQPVGQSRGRAEDVLTVVQYQQRPLVDQGRRPGRRWRSCPDLP